MPGRIDQGDVVTAYVEFSASGVELDPTTLTCTVVPPGLAQIVYTYGVDAALVRDSLGHYHIDVDTTAAAGTWWVHWISTGAGQATESESFYVQALPTAVAGTTRKQLRHEIDLQLRLVAGTETAIRTATGGTTSTLVDTGRAEADDFWTKSWLYIAETTDGDAPEGEEAQVTAYSANLDTFTVSPAFTAAVGAGDSYELRRYFPASLIHSVINQALEEGYTLWPEYLEDESLVIKEDVFDYNLPDVVEIVRRIEVPIYDVEYRGTATGGGSDSLTDSTRNWTVDALAGLEVAIYDGTGAGQYRTIESNTATEITVTVNWTTAPGATSKYVVKDLSDSPRVVRITQATIVGQSLHLKQALPEGQRLRIVYVPSHIDLESDSAVTTLPKAYVVMVAMKHLLMMAPTILPEGVIQQQAISTHDRLEARIERYIQRNRPQVQPGTYWNRGGGRRYRWTSPNRRTIGNRRED